MAAITTGMVAVAAFAAITAGVPPRHNHIYFLPHQLGRKIGKAIAFPLGGAIFKNKIASFNISEVAQTLPQCIQIGSVHGRRNGLQEADATHSTALLRIGSERPRCRRTTDKTEKFPPPHASLPGLGDGIVSAQTNTLIGAGSGFATAT
jgi:hypothetical protein